MYSVPTSGRDVFITSKTSAGVPSWVPGPWAINDNCSNRTALAPAMVHSSGFASVEVLRVRHVL